MSRIQPITSTPVKVPAPFGATGTWASVASRSEQTFLIDTTFAGMGGGLWGFGWNAEGEIGVKSTATKITYPTLIAPMAPSRTWKKVAAGDMHTCALDNAGGLFCWGEERHGTASSAAEVWWQQHFVTPCLSMYPCTPCHR